MAIFAGPKVNNDGIVFHVDGLNYKSFPGNGTLQSMPTKETVATLATNIGGYLYSASKDTEVFNNTQLTGASAITACFSIKHSAGQDGTVFSINSGESTYLQPTSIISVDSHIIFTTTVPNAVASISTFTASSTISVDQHTIFTTTVPNTVASISTFTSSTTISVDQHTIFTTTVPNVIASISTFTSSTAISVDPHVIFTTTVTSIESSSFSTLVELSVSFNSSSVVVRNRNMGTESWLTESLTDFNGTYVVIFRPLNNAPTAPITIYKNGTVLSTALPMTGSTAFSDQGVQLFSKGPGNSYSNYGVGFLSLYNREISTAEIQHITSLARDI